MKLERERMVERQIRARGVSDARVLQAMRDVPREAFLPPELADLAYDDRPLPIEAGQTISQPYIVAVMTEALRLTGSETVLEIGTGSGYAAAVLARVARHVYTIERHAELADLARERLAALGITNVDVRCDDGTLGWPEHAPFDAIVVAASGPELPQALLDQLTIGGRLVIPVGTSRAQELVRVTRTSEDAFKREELGAVQFVPLIGEQGWADADATTSRGVWPPRLGGPLRARQPATRPDLVARLIAECAEPITRIEDAVLDGLIERIGNAQVVLLGEATHGTSEFYRMRTRITQELILRRGFTMVAVEADWPDAAVVDRYVRGQSPRQQAWIPFSRFPTWMWRNREVLELVEWLRAYNQQGKRASRLLRPRPVQPVHLRVRGRALPRSRRSRGRRRGARSAMDGSRPGRTTRPRTARPPSSAASSRTSTTSLRCCGSSLRGASSTRPRTATRSSTPP